MKSLVCNVVGMALAVACLAMVLNRPSVADDGPAVQEQKQVVVVTTDDGATTEQQEHVIVVKADGEKPAVADAMKKAIRMKLQGLPTEIQKKIQGKLKAVKQAGDGQQDIQVEVVAVGSDEEPGAEERSASDEEHTATVVAKAFPDAQDKHMALAIALDGKELAGDDQLKTITVTVKDGQVTVNGKPVEVPALEALTKGQVKVLVSACAQANKDKPDGEPDQKKVIRKKMLIMSKDGETKTLDIDADSNIGAIAVGEAKVVVEGKPCPEAEAKDGTFTWTVVGDDEAKKGEGVHKFQVRALKGVPGKPMPHAFYFQPGPVGKADAEVVKRLKGIEGELKQIRKLLEEIQKEDADD